MSKRWERRREGGSCSQRDEASLVAWSDRVGDVCLWVHRFVMLSTPPPPSICFLYPGTPRGGCLPTENGALAERDGVSSCLGDVFG